MCFHGIEGRIMPFPFADSRQQVLWLFPRVGDHSSFFGQAFDLSGRSCTTLSCLL